MHEVIQQIIASEAEAKQIIAAARVEANRLLAQAREQAEAMRAIARHETQAEVGRIAEEAARAVALEKKARISHAATELEQHLRLDNTLRQRFVDEIVRCVCGLKEAA
jgi:vacuolar-type H+-ATPase subunit H